MSTCWQHTIPLMLCVIFTAGARADVFTDYLRARGCAGMVIGAVVEQRSRERSRPGPTRPPGNVQFTKKQREQLDSLTDRYWREVEKLRVDLKAPDMRLRGQRRIVLNKEESRRHEQFRAAVKKMSRAKFSEPFLKILTANQRRLLAKESAARSIFLLDEAMHETLSLTKKQRVALKERTEDVKKLAEFSGEFAAISTTFQIVEAEFFKNVLTEEQRARHAELRLTDEEFQRSFGRARTKSK